MDYAKMDTTTQCKITISSFVYDPFKQKIYKLYIHSIFCCVNRFCLCLIMEYWGIESIYVKFILFTFKLLPKISDGKKVRNTMTTVREAGLSRPEAGLDPRLTSNGATKEVEECHVSQKLAVLQEESLKPIKEDLAEWIARTLGQYQIIYMFILCVWRIFK